MKDATSWPGLLMERALRLIVSDFRRSPGPIGMVTVLATAPLAVIRRFPGPAIGAVLAANFVFVIFGRLAWSVAAFAGWMIALGASPLMLRKGHAVVAFVATEAAVLLGGFALTAGYNNPGTAAVTASLQCEHDDTLGANPYVDAGATFWAHATTGLQLATE